jgi:polyhydroxybutyrate depolymerase
MSKAVLIFAASLTVAGLAIGGGFAAPNVASAASCPTGSSTGLSVQTMTSGGVQRSYRLYVPTSYDASTPLPLVLNFHGFSSNAWQQERYSGFIDIAEREGFVLVTPDGTSTPRRWHIYGKWERGYVDDFAFTEDLIDEVSAGVCIDQARVYATGISNGAAMSSLLGCKSDRIAAIGPVAGSPYSALLCRNAGPVPVIAFHGTDDELVPCDGGNGGRRGLPGTPVRENMLGWAEHSGCDVTLQTERIASDVLLERYTICDEGADVLLYVIEGGGHTWPGARVVPWLGYTTLLISSSELIWSFFVAH